MSELSGTLDGVGLPAIIRFLAALNKTGCLRVTHDNLVGEVFFDSGQVTAAALGSRAGLAALDGLIVALPQAAFQFDGDLRYGGRPNIDIDQPSLLAHLDEIAARIAVDGQNAPALDAVPRVAAQGDGTTDETLSLDRGMLQTLLAVNGQRSVRDIVAQRASFDAWWQLGKLNDLGLVAFGPDVTAAAFQQVPPGDASPALTAEQSVDGSEPATARCPDLGFEDDRAHSFNRPTRLHRCYAVEGARALSIEQQRDLCLTNQFSTCSRLASVSEGPQPADEPRLVPMPFNVRGRAATAAQRGARAGRASADAEPEVDVRRPVPRPTPLRVRIERPAATGVTAPTDIASPRPALRRPPIPVSRAAAAAAAPSATNGIDAPRSAASVATPSLGPDVPQPEPRVTPDAVARRPRADAAPVSVSTPERPVPVRAIALAGTVIAVLIAAVGYLLLPQFGGAVADDGVDPATLPNSAAVLRGTPVTSISQPRPTVAPRATAGAASAPTTAAIESRPTTGAAAARAVLDEQFMNTTLPWPSSADGTAQLTTGAYRLTTRQPGQFVALGAPIADILRDVTVDATFHKASGPAGGGYGVILRDQATTPQKGTSQDGRYYVLEVGDKGEIGMWRRDGDHWTDLLPWQTSSAVRTGTAVNELTARARGNRLTLSVNGVEVATRTDDTYTLGGVGLFVGGDGNAAIVDRFAVQTP